VLCPPCVSLWIPRKGNPFLCGVIQVIQVVVNKEEREKGMTVMVRTCSEPTLSRVRTFPATLGVHVS